ncbi:hypothetical protein QFC22_005717 [Naganishia vaughanmartiniae]|uniref:Uncharacterized protein n=1 Tax=Naganishia vaughanmartiniae TaxID=1424756 RepID=A0ACC2WR66_9TREE|nr:hypothetical protein QFC22_005717 [Naganishia vaughanmartiniae]
MPNPSSSLDRPARSTSLAASPPAPPFPPDKLEAALKYTDDPSCAPLPLELATDALIGPGDIDAFSDADGMLEVELEVGIRIEELGMPLSTSAVILVGPCRVAQAVNGIVGDVLTVVER